jgi:hypothetical protein
MDLGTIANVATAAAVIIGVVFGMAEIAHARRDREDRAAFEVVHAMLTPEWMRSVILVQSLPDGVTRSELEAEPRKLEAAQSVSVILETLGYSVCRRLVPIEVADDLLGGIIRVGWRKLRAFIEDERARSGSQKTFEWFHWLAERLDELRPGKTSLSVGAQEAYRAWRP